MAEMKKEIRISDEYRPIAVRVQRALANMGLFEIREIEGLAPGDLPRAEEASKSEIKKESAVT